ncbi:MAG: PfkB family carbohydrate kinase [Candidatus Omnitrophica bacterium]|nr:PfkB family carbohydrate kinase [Candidatus Omnitrophota bacterium]
MGIVVLGTVALDSVKTPHGSQKNMLGGSAAHFSMSARLFAKVHLAAVVGEDFPAQHIDLFRRRGIDVSSLRKEKGSTFKWEGEYRHDDLNTACTLNTELGVLTCAFPRLDEAQRRIKSVFLANYDPELQYQFLKEMQQPAFVGLDTMNFWIHNKRSALEKIMKKAHLLVLNDAEARDLSLENNALTAARALTKYGPRMVIVKKGEHGALFYSRDCTFALPAFPLAAVVDPTGAGDTFAGGVMGYLAKAGKLTPTHLRRAIAYGTIAASYNVQGFGMQKTAAMAMADVRARFTEYVRFFKFS